MAVATGIWFDSGCGAGPRARWLADGRIEIEGEGTPIKPLPAEVKQWASLIVSSGTKHGVSPSLVAAIMATESGGQQKASTWCCYGLMGFLPKTASWQAGRTVTSDELLNDPALSVDLGAKFIRYLMDMYKNNPIKVGTAYNAGSIRCGAPKNCPDAPNRWNAVTDCAQGKAVDYAGRVIGYNNAAVSSGAFGASAVHASGGGKASPLWLVAGAALVGGVWWYRR